MTNETKLLGSEMQACQQLLYRGTLVEFERLSNVYRDDSVSQETMSTVLEVVGHVTLLHYGSFPFTSVVGSESRPSSRGIFVT